MAKEVRSREGKRTSKPRKKWMECKGKKSVGADRRSTRIIRGCKKGMGREKNGWGNSNLTIVKILEIVLMYDLMVSYDIIVLLSLIIAGF